MFGCNTYGRVYVVSISHRIINSIREVSGKRRKKDKESERNSYYWRRSAERWLQGVYYEPCKERARENINIVVLCCKLHCNTKYSKMQIKLQTVCYVQSDRRILDTRVPEGEELLVLELISLIYESFVDLQGMKYIRYHRTLQKGWTGSKKKKRMATYEKNPNRINSIP